MNKKSSFQNFPDSFYQCCSQACFALALEKRGDAPNYIEMTEKSEELIAEMERKLGADSDLVDEYATNENALNGISFDLVYQQGFQDCVYLLRWIGAL